MVRTLSRQLQSHYDEQSSIALQSRFHSDKERAKTFSVSAAGLYLDYAKNHITTETIALLASTARLQGVERQRDAMFAGKKINQSEHRAVLHTALRAPRFPSMQVDGQNVSQDVHRVLEKMRFFSERIRSGNWTGFDGRPITDIVNIGIGGSYLGPKLVCQAFAGHFDHGLKSHFVSNVDGHDLAKVLAKVNPATTLFIIASKSFTTSETMMNAFSARAWLLTHASTADIAKHFVAVSTNTAGVEAFGIDAANIFAFWDWVGGRYSIWSAVGLCITIMLGFEEFEELLAGAHQMDVHFKRAPLEKNMPVLLALIGIWYRNFFGSGSVSIAPYHQSLESFPRYLQQLDMESNGKCVDKMGVPLSVASSPVIWGDVGTNGQHAYFQLLHQGTEMIPVDFIAALRPSHQLAGHHNALLANCFAQSEALMCGKSYSMVLDELTASGVPATKADVLARQMAFEGNRPSNTILMNALTPATLGALIALYEHKTFVQGVIWNINSFDQWGVELGKKMATTIEAELNGKVTGARHDNSTDRLIAFARRGALDKPAQPESNVERLFAEGVR